jgi:hypothetical protein
MNSSIDNTYDYDYGVKTTFGYVKCPDEGGVLPAVYDSLLYTRRAREIGATTLHPAIVLDSLAFHGIFYSLEDDQDLDECPWCGANTGGSICYYCRHDGW